MRSLLAITAAFAIGVSGTAYAAPGTKVDVKVPGTGKVTVKDTKLKVQVPKVIKVKAKVPGGL